MRDAAGQPADGLHLLRLLQLRLQPLALRDVTPDEQMTVGNHGRLEAELDVTFAVRRRDDELALVLAACQHVVTSSRASRPTSGGEETVDR